ncbi:MAG: fibronectin type III domain-containing protein, partial [Candidatus Rokuibacteriota bacterium]
LLLLAASALVACGKTGPPVAPELRVPAASAALHGAVDEQSIVVSWSGPGTRVDGSRLRSVALYRLYRREEPGTGPLKSAMLSSGRVVGYDEIATIRPEAPPSGASVQGTSVTWVDSRALSVGRRYVYVVTAEDALGRSSAPSERLVVPFLAAPTAPRALRATPGDRSVSLDWEAPALLMDGSPATGPLRYLVLRGTGPAGALAPITPEPVTDTSFTDTGVENDVDYRYAVRAMRVEPAVTATGEASAVVAAAPADTTRPAPPAALLAVPSPGAVRLAWNPSASPDVATYAVYRAGETGEFARIATAPAVATVYLDRVVRPGTTYRYAVTALDRARRPNESARSNVVSARVP